ncbi:GIY-YIG nuclease family protein [Streptomyces sp. NPDC051994]|uniref:GIY-YIG nuclease family protein n=1 Tax=Streptomyces sp. NPDC051994 TaxID=3155287 RepID=UPI00343B00C1
MTKRTALYRLYDAGDQLLYVGVAQDPKVRFRQHRSEKPWWPAVAMKDIEWFPSAGAALSEERRAIKEECPRHNERSVPWFPDDGEPPAEPVSMVALMANPHAVIKEVVDERKAFVITRYGRPIALLAPIPRIDQIVKGRTTGRRAKKAAEPEQPEAP